METLTVPCDYMLSLLEYRLSDISGNDSESVDKAIHRLNEIFKSTYRLRICFSDYVKAQILRETHPIFIARGDNTHGINTLRFLSEEITDDSSVRYLVKRFNSMVSKLVDLLKYDDNKLPFDVELVSPEENFIDVDRLRAVVKEQRYIGEDIDIGDFYKNVTNQNSNKIATYVVPTSINHSSL